MLNYILNNPKEYNELLQYFTIFLLITIGVIIYYMFNKTESLKKDISSLDLTCPPAPPCPSLKCSKDGVCPDCVCPDINTKGCPSCPSCPSYPDVNTNCPSVGDIVSGIFPGRNMGMTHNGEYFDINGTENYDLIPGLEVYDGMKAFPEDSILDISYKNTLDINNVNSNTNTSKSKKLNEANKMQDSNRLSTSSTTNNNINNIGIVNDKSPNMNDPSNTNPSNTNPSNTNPSNTNPSNTNPLTGNPSNTNPLTGNPLTGNPLTGNPSNTNP